MTVKGIMREFVVQTVEALIGFAETKILGKKLGVLYSERDNPELIQSVSKELRNQEGQMVLRKLEDLEKAVYHIAGKQQDMIMAHKDLEKIVVGTATTLEEMVNGIDVSVSAEESDQTEDDFLTDAWGTKKKTTSSTSN